MNTRRGILVLFVSVAGLLALGAYESESAAYGRGAKRVEQSQALLRLKRKFARLRREPAAHERREMSSFNETQNTCYAHSENEAQEKILARLEAEERAQLDRDVAEDPDAELRRYSYHMANALCDEGISERDKAAITADLSAQLRRSRLEISKVSEPTHPESDMERSHQIIKKHLGEERYLNQVMKCAKSSEDSEARSVARGIEYLGAMIGLTAEQQEQARSIYEKLSVVRGGAPISVLDSTGQIVTVHPSEVRADGSRTAGAPSASQDLTGREGELTRKFFSLLTPEQERKYRAFIDEHNEAMTFLMRVPFDLPEQLPPSESIEIDGSAVETEASSR